MSKIPPNSKVALITGASSGIGKALAGCFAADGWHVVLAARGVAKMEALAAALRAAHGVEATVIGADLQAAGGPEALHAEVKRRGLVLGALVNNAGFGTFGEFRDLPLADELGMVQLNVAAVVALTRLFLPDLVESRGKVLNTASTAAFQPGPYMAVYFATKAFVLSFSEAIAAELAGTGVTVTALCPGPTASGFQEAAAMNHSAMVKGKRLPSSEAVARAGYAAMTKGRRVYIPGFMNWLMAESVRLAPRRLATAIAAAVTRPA